SIICLLMRLLGLQLCSVCAVNVHDESYVMVSTPRDPITSTCFRSQCSPATIDIDSISSRCDQSNL
uniref:Secreted protein n=1 Tax=Aegilops tauschii subsp. strangulata TaxID=200361 RepID=A0A453MJW7_AEGTS